MSIEKRGKRYRVRVNDKSIDRKVTVGTFPSMKVARIAEANAEIEMRLYGFIKERKDTTLGKLRDKFLATSNHLSDGTSTWYANALKPAIAFFGEHHSVRRLNKGEAQEFAASLSGYAPNTARGYLKALSALMNYAIDLEYADTNPIVRLRNLPRKKRLEGAVRVVTPAEHERLVECVPTIFRLGRGSQRFRGYQKMVELLPHVGLRRAEAQGLTWDAIDFDAGTLSVRQQLRRDGTFNPELKTPKSRRTIQLSERALEILKFWRIECPPNELNLIFPAPSGKPQNSQQFYRIWKKACIAAGLEGLDPHDLRHSFATWHLSAGCNPRWVSEQMGHERPSVMLDFYAHLLPTADGEASQKVEMWYKRQTLAEIPSPFRPQEAVSGQ